MPKSFFFAWACCLSYTLQAQWTPEIRAIEDLLFDLKLQEAEQKLTQVKKTQLQNPLYHYQEASLAFIKAISEDTEQKIEESIDLIGSKISALDQISTPKEHTYLAQGELYVLRGILKERLGQTLKASLDFYSGYKKLKTAQKEFPNHPIFQMYWGVVQATIGSLPLNYQSYLKMIGFKGDVDEGLEMIEKNFRLIMANPKYSPYQKRASINFAISYHQLSNDKNFDLEHRGVQVKGIPIFELGMAKICFEQNRASKALEYIQAYEKHTGIERFHYFYYLRGKVQLAAGHPQADQFFVEYLQHYSGKNFIKASHRYLAWFYLIQKDQNLADKHRKLALEKGQAVIWSDKSALQDVQEPFNRILLLARIKYDGGFYTEALQILKSGEKNCRPTISDQVEWNYRMGRVYQAQEKNKLATVHYKKALELHQTLDFNVGNSALQIALIAESENQKEQAKKYFKLCLTYSGFRYQEGVHQKAKAGLARLKN